MKIFLSLIYLLLFPFLLISQDIDFNKYLEDQDIIILKENSNIFISGNKAALMLITVSKEVSYRINHVRGIPGVSLFTLPEPLDKTFISHSSDIRSNARMFRGIRMENFSASVERADGSTMTIEPEIKMYSERLYSSSLGEAEYFEYRLNDLQEGDILNISYSYSFPFRNNWLQCFSSRYFFHSEYPKLNVDFSFTHPATLKVDTFLFFLEAPGFLENGNDKTYSWHFEDLPGCLLEPGNRPYKELPHFIFSPKPYELIYEHWDSFRQEFVPLWLLLCSDRERNIRPVVMDAAIGAKDRDNLNYNKIANNILNEVGSDSTGYNRMHYFQNWMVENVKYDNSISYYDNQENYKIARPSGDLMGGILKDYAIESTYATMIFKLGLNFFTAYPSDKRSGEISEKYFATMYNNDLMFATILLNNVSGMVIPRSQYNQYYFEELPFYYEDIPVILVHTNDFGGYKANLSQSLRTMFTPASNLADNARKVKASVYLDLDHSTASFKTSQSLSGQYSTLCRPVYYDQATDPTINTDYLHKIWEVKGDVIVGEVLKADVQEYFPFRTNISAEFIASDLIETKGETCTIDLSDCFYHIGYGSAPSSYRFTDFYPDFTGTDQFAYQLTFDRAIKLLDENPEISWNNDYFSYSFSLTQHSPEEIVIMSYLAWKSNFVPKKEHEKIRALLEMIAKNRKLSIQVELL